MSDKGFEVQIVRQLQDGSHDAFRTIFSMEKSKCTAIAYGILYPDYQEALDVVQQSFLKLWQHREQLDASQGYRQWLYKCIRNQGIDILRRRKNRFLLVGEAENRVHPERLWEVEDEIAVALAHLSEKQRQVLLLKYWGEFSIEEIAVMLQIPSGTVGTRLFKGYQRLREILREER